jgi:hypothetical protein
MHTSRKWQLQEIIVEKYAGKKLTFMIIDPDTGVLYVIAS